MSIKADYHTSIMNDREVDLQVLNNLWGNIGVGIAYSHFFILLGTALLITGILNKRGASFDAMTVRDITKNKWQFIVASIIGLTGAFAFYDVSWRDLSGAFAGDSWWTSDFAMRFFQFAIVFGGVCVGVVPGAVWLLCLRQRWVLPFLWVAGCAILLPVFEKLPMRNESMGLLYGGLVVSGFVVGIAIWIYGRRHVKTGHSSVVVHENPAISHTASIDATIKRKNKLSESQFVVASIVGLIGAYWGGLVGAFAGGFLGDSHVISYSVLNFGRHVFPFAGVCLGVVPGAIWLLCLRERWVLPFLWAGCCALLYPAFEKMMPLRIDSRILLYSGFVISGFVVGIAIWICGRRHKEADNTQKQIPSIRRVTRRAVGTPALALILLTIWLLDTDALRGSMTKLAAFSNPVPEVVLPVPKIEFLDFPELGKSYRGRAGMNMVWIAPGSFQMGGTTGQYVLEVKPVEVRLSTGFWLGETEVTQGQWQEVMKSNTGDPKGESLPVNNVNWNDAVEFCKKLTVQEREAGRIPEGMEYRLPTEAQWEYACRAGTKGDFAGDVNAMAWSGNDHIYEPREVKTKRANYWGLYDMHGNVKELCRDAYVEKLPGGTDPFVENGDYRVCRGGSYNNAYYMCSSAARLESDPEYESFFDQGLRVAAFPSSGQ